MVRNTPTISFQALEVKGNLLPSSLLEDIAKLNRSKELLLEDKDFDLSKGERLRDCIDAAWILTKKLWEEYKILKSRSLSLAGLHFSQRFLTEVLSWADIEGTNGLKLGESHYPITHLAFERSVQLILKGIDPLQINQGSSEFGEEGRRRSPYSCLQECLNADDNANWGLLMCGNHIHLLHDNPSLVKPSYLNADLELLIEGDLIDEFSTLWLIFHFSRFIKKQNGFCILDQWKQEAEKSGERVRGALRVGVENALVQLGDGFLNHPKNKSLRYALFESKTLSIQKFHEQLLRLIYRFLFLFTIEDRDMLFPQSIERSDTRRQIYEKGYSVTRLRDLAIKRNCYEGDYEDLWYLQRLVFTQLNIEDSPLGLPGLGGLFAIDQCPELDRCEIWNNFLLQAIKEIGWFRSDKSDVLTRVRYRDLNTEELGSVYEGLLELHPQLKNKGSRWSITYSAIAGSERKTSGSYYTPDALVQELIKSALNPVIENRLKRKDNNMISSEEALLNIKVIDPACGSGHFLLAAARRLAIVLAEVRAEENQPSEEDRQHALRDVVANCIFAVDKNPMAVELCKVALWIEAIEPGKPLSFLDTHIQCGDSLVGLISQTANEEYIPDSAYKPLTQDNKKICNSLKKDNASARKLIKHKGSYGGLQGSLNFNEKDERDERYKYLQVIERMPEKNLKESSTKKKAYTEWLAKYSNHAEIQAPDIVTSAFFIPKNSETISIVPTTDSLLKFLAGQAIDEPMIKAIKDVAKDFCFFHWYFRFNEVMINGGFDCLLSNPPWEKIKLLEKEYFSNRSEIIAKARNKTTRESLINNLNSEHATVVDKSLFRDYQQEKFRAEASSNFFRGIGHFKLTAIGDLNTYPLFAELFQQIINSNGFAGIILPSGIATDFSCQSYFQNLITNKRLISLKGFDNALKIFPAVHSDTPFSLLTIGKNNEAISCMHYLLKEEEIKDKNREYNLTSEDIALINPNTKTSPIFRSKYDSNLTRKIYNNIPIMIKEEKDNDINPWGLKLITLFHMSGDSHLFTFRCNDEDLPLYEAKLIHQYDHRWATYEDKDKCIEVSLGEKSDPDFNINPRYWINKLHVEEKLNEKGWEKEWFICWRAITNATNSRSVIGSILPKFGAGNSCHVALPNPEIDVRKITCLVANINSLVFDYVARQKIGGLNFNIFIAKQLPLIPPESYNYSSIDFISKRVLELIYTTNNLKAFALDLNYMNSPFNFDPGRRSILCAELDAYFANLYGLTRDELEYILDPEGIVGKKYPTETFRVLKKNEINKFGEYRTRRLVLEAWDNLFTNN